MPSASIWHAVWDLIEGSIYPQAVRNKHPEAAIRENLIVSTPNAYTYPLLRQAAAHQLAEPVRRSGRSPIAARFAIPTAISAGMRRASLASALEGLGVRHGATVAVMDWDSHRYLESYFAIPMMGATLFTVNVRLAPHQIAYALNDSKAEIVLVHADFVPMLDAIKGELTSVREVVVLADGQAVPATTWAVAGEYEELVGQASPTSNSATSTRTPRTPPLHQRRPAIRRVSTTATARSCYTRWRPR